MGKATRPDEAEVIDVKFTVVTPPAVRNREPILQPGWAVGLVLMAAILGIATLARLYSLGDWPFTR